MRCSCRICGTYMVQVEHGLNSGCKCPDCGAMCHDCMGSSQPPMSVSELRAQMAMRMRVDVEAGTEDVDLDPLASMRPDPDTD